MCKKRDLTATVQYVYFSPYVLHNQPNDDFLGVETCSCVNVKPGGTQSDHLACDRVALRATRCLQV
jgi:hypothetical protein